jgi:adenosylmethionine-8-amino-7-oxononanoate aminotransferase
MSSTSTSTRQIHRSLRAVPPSAVRATGAWIESGGKRFIDACGGAAVVSVGHGHPAVLEAMQAQLGRLAYVHSSFFTSDASEQLAERLSSLAAGSLEAAMFMSSGSEAVESALKLARQSAVEAGAPHRTVVISRLSSYHGNTLGALGIGGNANRRRIYEPWLIPTEFVDPCFAYHGMRADEDEQAYSDRLVSQLEQRILAIGPDKVLAFIAETVVGATTGAVPPTRGYLTGVRKVCDRYGVLMILDEVMCGSGRTGTFFAFEQERVVPDIAVLAKGLGGGYVPLSAVMAGPRVLDPIRAGSGGLANGFTAMGHPLACAAGLAVLDVMLRERLLENVQERGVQCLDAFTRRLSRHPHVGDIRGRGLFIAVEFVADRDRKLPFDPAMRIAAAIKEAALAEGLLVYVGSGTVDGVRGDHALIAPPYTVTKSDVEEIADRLARAVDRVWPEGRS